MGYSPTEYAEFTEPPAEMSSHRFLLRRVWHLAIPTPPAMGYSPTEYAEFTEPPTEISSHGFHRFTQILRVRCSPTEFTEFTEFGSVGMAGMPYPPTSVRIRVICGRLFSARGSVSSVLICGRLFSARSFCAFRAFCGNLFSPTEFTEFTEFGSVGMAGMPYPPTSVRIRVICGSLFSARSFCEFRAFCGNIFPPTDFTDLHRYLWCAVLPQNSQNTQNLAAWVWQGCHTLLICEHPCHPWESFLCNRFCEFRAFCGNLFPPTDFTDLHRYLWCAVLPQNSQNTQNLAAWVWQGCHTLLICEHPCHPWESFLCNRFCEFRAFCGNLFPPTDFTDLHRYLWCAVLPQNSQNTQNLAAWVWQGCHTLLICFLC